MKVTKITGADGTVYELPKMNISAIQNMIDTAIRAEREREHPVGSLWANDVDIDPAVHFGFGTWQRIEGRFLLGASSDYPAGSTGGSAMHKHATQGHVLVPTQLPYQAWCTNPTDESSGIRSFFNVGSTYGMAAGENNRSQPHDHGDTTDGSSMPPYLATYIWRRTA